MVRNNKKDNKKKTDNKEVAGVVLIMISAFFLLCLILGQWIMGDISLAVKNVTVGLLGFAAYPIFLAMLLCGIAILKRMKPETGTRYVGGIIVITVLFILILQLAMSYSLLASGVSAGGYMSAAFDGFTAGGVVFGIIAYAVQAVVTLNFAFVVFALGIIFTALFMSWDKIKNRTVKRQKVAAPESNPIDTSNFNRSLSRPHGLYVDKIMPKKDDYIYNQNAPEPQYADENTANGGYVETKYGSFDELNETRSNGITRYSDNAKGNEFNPYNNKDEKNKKNKGRNIIEEARASNPFALMSGYASSSSSSKSKSSSSSSNSSSYYGLPPLPPLITSVPDIKTVMDANKRPPKIVNIEDTGLQSVVVPPPKNYDDQIIGGHIINGDELSKIIADEQSPNSSNRVAAAESAQSGYGAFIPQANQEADIYERAPILNGDYFNRAGAKPKETQSQKTDGYASGLTSASSIFSAMTAGNPVSEQPQNAAPIISGDYFSKGIEREQAKAATAAESAYKKLGIPEIFIPPQITERQSEVITNEIGDKFGNNDYNDEKDYFENNSSKPSEEIRADAQVPNITVDDAKFKDVSDFVSVFENKKSAVVEANPGNDFKSFNDFFKPSSSNVISSDNLIAGTDNMSVADEDEEEFNNSAEAEKLRLDELERSRREEIERKRRAEESARKKEEDARIKAQEEEGKKKTQELERHKREEERRKRDNERILDEDDEVEDLTARGFDNPNDSTGYYNTISEGNKKPDTGYKAPVGFGSISVEPKLKPENQIKIDEYARTAAPAVKPKSRRAKERYNPPPLDFLISSKISSSEATEADSNEKARLLEDTLSELKLPATVNAITRGPTVTRYELEMPPGIPIKRIEQFAKDIEYSLAIKGKIRIETPIPGKRAVGIEIPNDVVDIVRLREILSSKEFVNSTSPATLALGKDIAGSVIVCQLEKMPHLLIAGQTGSGKSACLNSIIMSILYKATPDDVRIILIDPKRVEFTIYRDMPHLLTGEIITESVQTLNALKWLKIEMERRYTLFSQNVVRNLSEYNKLDGVKCGDMEKLPVLILVIDEMADLMLSDNRKDLEERIMNLAAKSRAAGIHLILATQRPSVDVITGTIKANLPSCIAFAVKSVIDSRTILDSAGAEALLGNGDMIYAPAGNDFTRRVQGSFVTNEEVTQVVSYVKENNIADFDDDFKNALTQKEETSDSPLPGDSEFDVLVPEVLKLAIVAGQISATFIQQRFSVGYPRASKIMYQLEKNNFISANEGNNKPRTVFLTRERYAELFHEEI